MNNKSKNMKRVLFAIIVAIAAQYSYAQNIAGVHRLRVGDEVHRQAAAYIEADDGAQDILWDFSQSKGQVFD